MRLQNIQDSNFYVPSHTCFIKLNFCFVSFCFHYSHAQCAYPCCWQPILLTARNIQSTIHLIWSILLFFESFHSLTVCYFTHKHIEDREIKSRVSSRLSLQAIIFFSRCFIENQTSEAVQCTRWEYMYSHFIIVDIANHDAIKFIWRLSRIQ